MSDDRIKLPPLDRTGPIRSWAAMLGANGASASSNAPASNGERPSAPGDVISRSVELGYRVVDEYITQGRRAAERLGVRPFAPLASMAPMALGGDPQELGARMMRYASDFVGVWMQLMESATNAGALRPVPPAAAPPVAATATATATQAAPAAPTAANRASAPPSDGTRVRVEIASLWPTEVVLDLRPEAARVAVIAHALRALDPELPRIDGVSFANGPDEDPPLLRVRIPPSQPPGVYNGLLVDRETSRPVGTVSVRLWRE
jgi:hypothetical protein